MTPEPLAIIAEGLDGAALWAYVHGDVRAGDRLLLLARCVADEAEYQLNVERHGMALVRRQSGRSLGWLLAFDADVRARRRAVGLSLP